MEKSTQLEQVLADLSTKELAELLSLVFANRRERKTYKNEDFQFDDVLCLAKCSFGSNSGVVDEEAIIELYASPSTDEAEDEGVLSEQGSCGVCKAWLVSSAQIAHCPICGEKAYLT